MQCGAPPKIGPEVINQEISHIADDFVSFDDAQYEVICPTCGDPFLAKGRSLAKKPFIKCPHLHIAGQDQKIPIGTIKNPSLVKGHVIYRRLTDFCSYAGRISVADYWLSSLLVLPLLLLFKLIPGPVGPLAFFALFHPLWIKRYHDHGMRGEWVTIQGVAAVTSSIAILLMPKVLAGRESYPIFALIHGIAVIACVITGIMISCMPGKPKINRYGPPKSDVKRVWW